jgi:hypothetical protein
MAADEPPVLEPRDVAILNNRSRLKLQGCTGDNHPARSR